MEMLSRHLARRRLTGAHVDAYVFVAPEGGPLDYSHFRDRVWLPACKAAGLTGLCFHDLRHAQRHRARDRRRRRQDRADPARPQRPAAHAGDLRPAVTEADRAATDKSAERVHAV
jgi:integrase